MITISNFRIEENFPLSIEKDENGEFLLTTGRQIAVGEPTAGGLAVNFEITIDGNFEKSWISILQICQNHKFNVLNSQGEFVRQDKIDGQSLVLDGLLPDQPFYKKHLIENNELKAWDKFSGRYLFFDAPFVYLEEDWFEVYYKIKFQTHICYTHTIDEPFDNHKILHFDWFLECSTKRDENNIWTMLTNDFSTNDYILDSIKYSSGIFDVTDFKNLITLLHKK